MGSHVGKTHVDDVLIGNLHLKAVVACADNLCEAVLALAGVRHEVVGAGTPCTARYRCNAEVGPREDGHLCGVREAIVRERVG